MHTLGVCDPEIHKEKASEAFYFEYGISVELELC